MAPAETEPPVNRTPEQIIQIPLFVIEVQPQPEVAQWTPGPRVNLERRRQNLRRQLLRRR